jgi:serine phosphatase RsbU (regulator of sigma subunit)/Flp pilus assembly protein TadD
MKKSIIASVIMLVLSFGSSFAGSLDSLQNLLRKSPKSPVLLIELSVAYASVDTDSAIFYAKMAVEISENKNLPEPYADACFQLGEVYYKKGLYEKANEYYLISLKYFNKKNHSEKIAENFNSIGMTFEARGNYDSAIYYYNKSLEINQKTGNKKGLANNYNNIGIVYSGWSKFEEAIEYYHKALQIDTELNSKSDIAIDYNNLGLCYFYSKNNETAISYFVKAIELEKSLKKETNLPSYYNNLGLVYYQWQKFDTAMIHFEEALALSKKLKNDENTALYLCNIAAIHFFSNLNYEAGFKYYKEAEEIAIENRYIKVLYSLYNGYFKVYRNLGDYKKALESYILRSKYHDTIFNEQSLKQIDEFKVKYETEKIEKERELFKKDSKIKEIENIKQKEVNRKQFILLVVFIAGFIIILVLAFIVYRALKLVKIQKLSIEEKNEELNQQNEEIASQRDEIEKQRQELEIRNENINASIRYASRIQNALLPNSEHITKEIPPHFILFLPRDVVSGDFYWSSLQGKNLIIAAADCTGHGIPGAFMSMLGIAFLNEIVNKDKTLHPNQILNLLRAKVIESLHQTGKEDDSVDGMDIALAVINLETGVLQFSGANNPMWIIRNNEFIDLPCDKVPIGYHKVSIDSYNKHEFQLKKGDVFYLFSDGFADQFGGSYLRKFMKANLKDLLLEIHKQSAERQKEILHEKLLLWQGDNSQTDDILVIGMKF